MAMSPSTDASSALKDKAQSRFSQWINRRIPPQPELTLNQKRLFIFPSKQGLFFLLVLLLVLVAAINYQNNLAFGIAFFMASLFNTAILFTFSNLSGLHLKALKPQNAFAQEHVAFCIEASKENPKKQFHRVSLSFQALNKQHTEEKTTFHLTEHDKDDVLVFLLAEKRGVCQAPRLRVETVYPLGLIRCWSWVDLDMQALVYPKPMASEFFDAYAQEGEQDNHSVKFGQEDFAGLKNYQPGDSLKHAHWSSLAKGQNLMSKQFNANASKDHVLSYDDVFQGDKELALSKLCYQALQFHGNDEAFSLVMPNKTIKLSQGDKHLEQVLTQLAVY